MPLTSHNIQALLNNEKARQEAEENLKNLTQKVDSGVEEVNEMIGRMNLNASMYLFLCISTSIYSSVDS